MWFVTAILFILAHYIPDKKIFSDIAYPLLGINSFNLLLYSVVRWYYSKRNKEKGILNRATKQYKSNEEKLKDAEETK